MHAFAKKLKSTKGASMILVLALLLFCIMVSSVILSAAASGTSRARMRNAQQQAYLAVSSASKLVTEELKALSPFEGKKIETRYRCHDCSIAIEDEAGTYLLDANLFPDHLNAVWPITIEIPEYHENTETIDSPKKLNTTSTMFDAVVERAVNDIYNKSVNNNGTIIPDYKETFTISLEDARLPDVDCTFIMDENYQITVDIKAKDSDYAIQVVSLATTKDSKSTEIAARDVFFCEHVISYKIQEGTEWKDKSESLTIPAELTIYATTISWNEPEITKGVQGEIVE